MSKILYGDRAFCLMFAPDHLPVDCKLEGLDKGDGFEATWRQLSVKKKPLVFINPPKPSQNIKPRDDRWVVFEDKVPADWKKWATKNKVIMDPRINPSEEGFEATLTQGIAGVKFTESAASWYVRVVGTSMVRLLNEINKFVVTGTSVVDLDMAIEVIGGYQSVKANAMLKSLGYPASLKMALEVKESDIPRLLDYLDKALAGRKNSWKVALYQVKRAVMCKRMDFFTALQVFVHHCYLDKQGDKKVVLDTLRLTGSVRWLS